MKRELLCISAEVAGAIAEARPVVALESTIISHGMPYPRNLESALEVEQVVRENGAVPATVAVMDGRMVVGATESQIERLATARGVEKASRRDLALLLARRATAATTVAATMIGAHAAGIRIFATGGTGGVHRGGEVTMDVSADLQELARTPVAVVSAGVKSILDIGRTLEYLETVGVPVLGFGVDELPAFYSRRSGFRVTRVDGAPAAAAVLHAQWGAGLAGVFIANPIPESDELEHGYIEQIIQQAVTEAEAEHIRGKELTPHLLARIVELSGGASLEANTALVRSNAAVAATIAGELCALEHA